MLSFIRNTHFMLFTEQTVPHNRLKNGAWACAVRRPLPAGLCLPSTPGVGPPFGGQRQRQQRRRKRMQLSERARNLPHARQSQRAEQTPGRARPRVWRM